MAIKNRPHMLCTISICLVIFVFGICQPTAHCGWKDSYQKKKSNFKKNYNQKKKDYSKKYNQKKNDLGKKYNQKKKEVSGRYNQKKKEFSNKYKQKKEDISEKYQQKRRIAEKEAQKIKKIIEKKIEKSESFSAEAKRTAKKSLSRLGTSGGQAVTDFLKKTKGRGVQTVEQAMPIMQNIKSKVSDPEIQRRAMAGVLVAAATGAAIYHHRDNIQYLVASECMKNVKVPVNGQMQSIEDVYSEAILKRAPYLRGTAIAEDPAKMLAYGVTATAKDDLLNNVDMVPNGRGGLTSVNGAIVNATGVDQGLAALQVGDTMEGMAVETARNGQLGHNAQIFAAAYDGANKKIEGGR